jgi:flagellar biosynthetic protein FliP
LLLAMHLLRRAQAGALLGGGGHGLPLKVLRRVPLGPKQGVALLQVGERVLLVSVADGGAHLLAELGAEEREQALAAQAPSKAIAAFRRPRRGFAPILGRLLVLTALLAAAGASRAAPSPAVTGLASAAALSASPAAPGTGELRVTPPADPRVEITIGEGSQSLRLSGAVGLVVFLGFLTLLPALLLLMTSFTRILVVLNFLRPALGTQTTPPAQLLTALALLLTGVVMGPVLDETNRVAIQPFVKGQITQAEAYTLGVQPFREFMLANTREKDLTMFTELTGSNEVDSIEQIPLTTVVSAFVTSELRTAFQMGFVLFLPFVVVDLIVASVLMSLGMFMLPPIMISLPFKLLLFVLADGWSLVVQNLVTSFR